MEGSGIGLIRILSPQELGDVGDGRRQGGLWAMVWSYYLWKAQQKHRSVHCDIRCRITGVFYTVIRNAAGALL